MCVVKKHKSTDKKRKINSLDHTTAKKACFTPEAWGTLDEVVVSVGCWVTSGADYAGE